MSGKETEQKRPLTQESYLEVLEYQQSVDLVQAMEARGDFRFKGIYSLFSAILEWTLRFPANGILPGVEQLSRDTNLPEDKVKDYINELLGLGNTKERMIFAMPAVDYVRSPQPGIVKFLVYCRPTKSDGTSVRRYVQSYNEKNVQSLQKWIDTRAIMKGIEYAEYLHQYINRGRLPDSQGGAEVARFFYSDLDASNEMKKITYSLFARPVIQKLIESGHLLLLPEKVGGEALYKGVFFNKNDQIAERFRVLLDYFKLHIATSPVREDDPAALEAALRQTLTQNGENLGQGQKQVIYEILLLISGVQKIEKEATEKKKHETLDKFVEEIMKANRIVDISRVKNMTDEVRLQIPSVSQILYAEYPIQGRVAQFALHQKAILAAVKQAREQIENNSDDTEYQILVAMDVERYLDPENLKIFKEAEDEGLFLRLPWFVRVVRAMFGNAKVTPEEKGKIKKEVSTRIVQDRMRIQTEEAKRAQKKLVSERMKGGGAAEEKSAKAAASPQGAPSGGVEVAGVNQEEEKQKALERMQVEERVKQMIVELDRAWDEKKLPNRELLLEKFPEFDEDTLIIFLKKYGRKEIFSFRIKHDKPEYVWPILITKRYLRQNGKKLYSHYAKIADEQRKAMMPDQEKFDIATSIEDFLGKVFPKLK
jgi:hypothetical protein